MPTNEIQTPQVDGYGSVGCTIVLVKLHKYKLALVHFFLKLLFLHHVQVLQVMGVDELTILSYKVTYSTVWKD